MAYTKVTGNLVDIGDLDLTNVGQIQLDSIAGDADSNTSITFSGSDVITIATGGSGRLTIGDGALSPVTDNQIDLGTSSLEFKDAYFDGTVTSDAFAGPLTGDVTGNVSGTAATVTTAAQSAITSVGTLTSLGVDGAVTFNDSGNDVDFRVESNDSSSMLFVDGGENKVLVQANNTASVTDSATMTAASAFEINGNAGEGSDILRFFAMADGTGNYGMEVSNSGGNAQYDLMLNPINKGNVVIGGTSTGNAHSYAQNLVIGNTSLSRPGMTIQSAQNGEGRIFFADDASGLPGQIEYYHNGDYFQFYGGATFSFKASAGGIHIGGTGDANKLDDYEEGTWTPTFKDLGGNLATLSTANGNYTKIGRMVFLHFQITISSKGSMTGNYLHMGNLPFAHPTEAYNGSGHIDYFSGLESGVSGLAWDTSSTGSVMWLVGNTGTSSTASSYITASYLGGNEHFKGTVIYQTDVT